MSLFSEQFDRRGGQTTRHSQMIQVRVSTFASGSGCVCFTPKLKWGFLHGHIQKPPPTMQPKFVTVSSRSGNAQSKSVNFSLVWTLWPDHAPVLTETTVVCGKEMRHCAQSCRPAHCMTLSNDSCSSSPVVNLGAFTKVVRPPFLAFRLVSQWMHHALCLQRTMVATSQVRTQRPETLSSDATRDACSVKQAPTLQGKSVCQSLR